MFYFLYGTDAKKSRARMHSLLDGAKKKRPDAEVFILEAESFSPARLDALVGGMGLFEKKYIVLMDRVFENKESSDVILEKLKELAETENMFLFLEGKVDKKTLGKIEKYAFKVEVFEAEKEAGQKFNVFSLTDALARRDRKELWVLYQNARQEDAVPEAVCGMFFWKVKTMLTSGSTGKYSKEELQKFSSSLISIYHDAHRGLCDLDTALEKFVLSV